MATKIRTVDVAIVGCRDNNPIREFQIPDTGDATVNRKIAALVHRTLLGEPYECTRCSGGDYHFNRWVEFVGPVTHHVASPAAVTARSDDASSSGNVASAAATKISTTAMTGRTSSGQAVIEEPASKVVKITCGGIEIPVDHNGIPFVAPYDCC
jgi:hypothetical protein